MLAFTQSLFILTCLLSKKKKEFLGDKFVCLLIYFLYVYFFFIIINILFSLIKKGMNIFVAFSLLLKILAVSTPSASTIVPYLGKIVVYFWYVIFFHSLYLYYLLVYLSNNRKNPSKMTITISLVIYSPEVFMFFL